MTHFTTMDFAPKADENLLKQARETALKHSILIMEGTVFSTDSFYSEDANRYDIWIKRGVLGVEMESSILYTLAAKNKVQALSILTVSDNLITKEFNSAREREEATTEMMKLALEIS